MANTDKKEEEKIDVGLDTARLNTFLRESVPKSAAARLEQLSAEHEDNIVMHDDTVAVFEVSDTALAHIDGTPGTYKIARSDPENPIRKEDPDAPVFTRQGLLIYDGYRVVYNPIGIEEWRHQYVLVPTSEWNKHIESGDSGALMSRSQQMSVMMSRAGGSG